MQMRKSRNVQRGERSLAGNCVRPGNNRRVMTRLRGVFGLDQKVNIHTILRLDRYRGCQNVAKQNQNRITRQGRPIQIYNKHISPQNVLCS